MAVEKGAKVTKTKTVVQILSVKPPNADWQIMGEADVEDEAQVKWISDLRKQFKAGGTESRLIERTTVVRTQVTEAEL